MRWENLFADLEAQAEALAAWERGGEVDERTRAEIAQLGLVDRLRPAVGAATRLRCAGGATVTGTIARVNREWVLVETAGGREAWVATRAILTVTGLGRLSSAPGSAGVVESRLGLRSALRAIARDRSGLRIRLSDGSALDGTLDRVGDDFVEVAVHAPGETRRRPDVREVAVVPFRALVTLERDR